MRRPRADEPPAAGGGNGGPVPAAATAGGAGNAEAEGDVWILYPLRCRLVALRLATAGTSGTLRPETDRTLS